MDTRSYDTIRVYIPINVTVDLGIAIKRVREKRIRTLKLRYPSLFPKQQQQEPESSSQNKNNNNNNNNNEEDENEDENNNDTKKANDTELVTTSITKKSLLPGGAPRREDYGSVVDYLEAKYARGVVASDLEEKKRRKKVEKKQNDTKSKTKNPEESKNENSDKKVDDDSDNGNTDSSSEDDDGAGSTYSQGSGFIDDAELMTSVAEQVLASSKGMTKIEAEANKKRKMNTTTSNTQDTKDDVNGCLDYDDAAFFVNIGSLEMEEGFEETDAAKIDFNALDKTNVLKVKKKKRRKVTTTPLTQTPLPDGTTPTTNTTTTAPQQQTPTKKTNTTNPTSSNNSNQTAPTTNTTTTTSKAVPDPLVPPNANTKVLYELLTALKNEQERLHTLALKQTKELTSEHLPPLTTQTIKLSIKVPLGKKPGDEISFTNPRIPGQRLKVKIPENGTSGEKFIVSVPSSSENEPSNNSTTFEDVNKFPKEYKDLLDDYSRTYDEWIDTEYKYRLEMKCIAHTGFLKPNNEKMKKFNKLIGLFPTNLQTPVVGPYLRKIVRKARQNSSSKKRQQLSNNTLKTILDKNKEDGDVNATSKPIISNTDDNIKPDNSIDDTNNNTTITTTGITSTTTPMDVSKDTSSEIVKKKTVVSGSNSVLLKFPKRCVRFPEVLFCMDDFSNNR